MPRDYYKEHYNSPEVKRQERQAQKFYHDMMMGKYAHPQTSGGGYSGDGGGCEGCCYCCNCSGTIGRLLLAVASCAAVGTSAYSLFLTDDYLSLNEEEASPSLGADTNCEETGDLDLSLSSPAGITQLVAMALGLFGAIVLVLQLCITVNSCIWRFTGNILLVSLVLQVVSIVLRFRSQEECRDDCVFRVNANDENEYTDDDLISYYCSASLGAFLAIGAAFGWLVSGLGTGCTPPPENPAFNK